MVTIDEWESMWSQFVAASETKTSMQSQIVTASQNRRNTKVTPYAFTEQGVAMLSGILNSDKAIAMNIAIMRAFVEIRKVLIQENDLREQLKQIKDRIGEHDIQLNQLYDAMENLLDENAGQKNGMQDKKLGLNEFDRNKLYLLNTEQNPD